MFDDTLKFLLFFFIFFIILLPAYINCFRNSLWEYIKEKMAEEEKHEKLKKDMRQRRKNSQHKTKC